MISPDAPTVLAKIAQSVSVRLAERMRERSLPEIREQASRAPAPRAFTSLFSERAGEFPRVIAEVKFGSPSQGAIVSAHADGLRPREVAGAYLRAGATALSVLTEKDHFSGEIANLVEIRAAFPQASLLMKDFMLSEYQIYEARARGADAVLLILALLGRDRAAELQRLARALGLSVLVEVHDEAEMTDAAAIGADLIGVNNRNLKTLQVDGATSHRLRARAPSGVPLISESGIETSAQIAEISQCGYAGFLIGTALMRNAQPESALRQILRRPDGGRV